MFAFLHFECDLKLKCNMQQAAINVFSSFVANFSESFLLFYNLKQVETRKEI